MDRIALSIVVPVYNGEQYVEQCISNIEKQTFKNYEVIFVDDGSSDSSGEIIDRLISSKEKYRVFHKENGGAASARNVGIDNARGKYITFYDLDDELSPQIYEKMVNLIDSSNADIAVCGFYFKVENELKITQYLEPNSYPNSLYVGRDEIREKLVDMWDSDILSNVWNKVYRMSLIREKNLRYRDGHVYTEDRVYNRQFLENCESVVLTDECLYYYVRERVGSTTEKYRADYFTIRQKEYKEFQDHFKKMNVWNDKAREYVCREFVERMAGCIENIFHAGKLLSCAEKYQQVKAVVNNRDVRKALKHAKCRSFKMRAFVWPMKMKFIPGVFLMGKTINTIRNVNPALFHKIKNSR